MFNLVVIFSLAQMEFWGLQRCRWRLWGLPCCLGTYVFRPQLGLEQNKEAPRTFCFRPCTKRRTHD